MLPHVPHPVFSHEVFQPSNEWFWLCVKELCRCHNSQHHYKISTPDLPHESTDAPSRVVIIAVTLSSPLNNHKDTTFTCCVRCGNGKISRGLKRCETCWQHLFQTNSELLGSLVLGHIYHTGIWKLWWNKWRHTVTCFCHWCLLWKNGQWHLLYRRNYWACHSCSIKSVA